MDDLHARCSPAGCWSHRSNGHRWPLGTETESSASSSRRFTGTRGPGVPTRDRSSTTSADGRGDRGGTSIRGMGGGTRGASASSATSSTNNTHSAGSPRPSLQRSLHRESSVSRPWDSPLRGGPWSRSDPSRLGRGARNLRPLSLHRPPWFTGLEDGIASTPLKRVGSHHQFNDSTV